MRPARFGDIADKEGSNFFLLAQNLVDYDGKY